MEPRGRRSPRLGPLGSWPPHSGAGGGPCLAALCGRAFLTNGRPVSPRVDVCLNHGSDSVRVLCRILGTLSRPSSCITVSIVMLMVPRDLRSYTLIDWGHLELPAQSQHLDGHISVCSDCPPGQLAPDPMPRASLSPAMQQQEMVRLGPPSAHAREEVPCPCKADGAPCSPYPPEACPEGGHSPFSGLREAGLIPGPQVLSVRPAPPRLPFVPGQWTGRPQLREPWRGKASIWCRVCLAGSALEPAASLLGESLVASSCSPSQWAQQGAGRRWGAEAAFREARLSRDQRPAPGWTEGWCHLPPESQLPWGHGCLPASPHPSGDISVRVRRPGHIHLGEQPNPGLLTSGLCPWSADLCRHSRPLQSVRGLSGPLPGISETGVWEACVPGVQERL